MLSGLRCSIKPRRTLQTLQNIISVDDDDRGCTVSKLRSENQIKLLCHRKCPVCELDIRIVLPTVLSLIDLAGYAAGEGKSSGHAASQLLWLLLDH